MGKIVELATRPDRLRKAQEEELREALLPFEDRVPGGVFRQMMQVIDRSTSARNKWTFVMLSPEQNLTVVNYLASNSKRPIMAMKAWATCFQYLRIDTGEIMLTREQLAEQLGTDADNVSRCMSELVALGAITRRREKEGGLKGPGLVRYFMNPRVATHLGGGERDKAQDEAPPLLRLIEAGRPAAGAD